MPAPTAHSVCDQLALEFREAPQDIHHQIMSGAVLGRKLLENELNLLAFQLSFDNSQMGDIAGQSVDIID
jgi:hypothetical protein